VENNINEINWIRLIINLPPRHLKSLLASVAFPAWWLGHEPSAQILCVSYAQDLADKLSRDCRRIMTSDWYQRIFPTRLWPQRQAVRLHKYGPPRQTDPNFECGTQTTTASS
jgi:hypothetical protein